MAQANTRPDRGQRGRVARDKNFYKSMGAGNSISTAMTREDYVTKEGYYMKQGAVPAKYRGK